MDVQLDVFLFLVLINFNSIILTFEMKVPPNHGGFTSEVCIWWNEHWLWNCCQWSTLYYEQTENAYSWNNLSLISWSVEKKINCQLFLLIHSVIFEVKLQENMSMFNPFTMAGCAAFLCHSWRWIKGLWFTLKMSYLRDITLGSGQSWWAFCIVVWLFKRMTH